MASTPILNNTNQEVPLCIKHFLDFAKEHHNLTSSHYHAVSRVQPQRAAKNKVQRASPLPKSSKKRSAADDDSETPAKRRKVNITQHLAWPEKRLQLIKLLCDDVEAHRREGECTYGTRPLVCRQCEMLKGLVMAKHRFTGWNYHRGVAPIANMRPIGEKILISEWKSPSVASPKCHALGVDGDVSFVVDACRDPMVIVF